MWGSEGKCRWNICLKFNFKVGETAGGLRRHAQGDVGLFETHTDKHTHTHLHSQELFSFLTHTDSGLKWFTGSFSLTHTHTHSHLVTSCAVKIAATHSQSLHTSKAFSSNCIWQLDSKSQRTERSGDLLLSLHPQQNAFYSHTDVHCKKKTRKPRRVHTTHKHTNTSSKQTNTTQHTLNAAQTGNCSVCRSSEVIKLREGSLSGQISTGFQHESV